MTTEDLMKLADVYARLNAQTTAPGAGDARQELLDAIEAQRREIERLTQRLKMTSDTMNGYMLERDTLRAELAAIRATQEPVAYCVYFPTELRQEFCQDLDDLMEDLTNLAHEVTPLYASPAAKDAGLVADGWQPIETAPKDGTVILAWCDHEADDFLDKDDHLTTYATRCEGLGHVQNGIHSIMWEEGQEITDGWENPSYWLPGGWVHNADPEAMANPTHWMPLPASPKLGGV